MSKTIDEMWAEVGESRDKHNKAAEISNNRILKWCEAKHGKAFVNNLLRLYKDCEVGSQMGFLDLIEIVNCPIGSYQPERYGSKIRGYWVDQWSVGTEGDSFEGYIYVKIRSNRFLKVRFSI